MSLWSSSVYSEPSSFSNNSGFLSQLDKCLYEGIPMDDPNLDAEARLWSERFLHLRVVGEKIEIPRMEKRMDSQTLRKETLSLPEMRTTEIRSPKLLNRRMTNSFKESPTKPRPAITSTTSLPRLHRGSLKK